MDFSEFVRLSLETENLLSAGRLKDAESAVYQLIIRDISDLDKASLCLKMAFIFDRLGNSEEAIAWYEKGSAYEQIHARFEITEKKAEYLSQLGRNQEAIAIYEELYVQPYLTEEDKNRIRKLIQSLVGKVVREGK